MFMDFKAVQVLYNVTILHSLRDFLDLFLEENMLKVRS